tara:strand:- start:6533 stop:6811 length:279 start_codon:yes stop_codon:yes gene_type:complete
VNPEEHKVSHLEIYKLLIEVKTTLDLTLKRNEEDRVQNAKDKTEIFHRINKLENRMAQVVVIALAMSVLIPVSVELFAHTLLPSAQTINRPK